MTKTSPSPLRLTDPADPIACLRFLVAVAQTDLARVKPADLDRLAQDVQRFIHRRSPGHWRTREPAHLITLQVLQQRARGILSNFATPESMAIAGDLRLSLWALVEDGVVRVLMRGTDLHLWLYQIVRVLEEAGPGKVIACPATFKQRGAADRVCGALFVKVTTKQYCSQRCQTRMTTRANRG